jgi:hypothetical protein
LNRDTPKPTRSPDAFCKVDYVETKFPMQDRRLEDYRELTRQHHQGEALGLRASAQVEVRPQISSVSNAPRENIFCPCRLTEH